MTEVALGTLFQLIRNGLSIGQDKSGRGLPIARIETIADSEINQARVGYAGLDESGCRSFLLQPGDILFSHINSVPHLGKCAVYRGRPEKLVHGMNLLCLRPETTRLLPEFAKHLLRSPTFRSRALPYVKKAVNQASISIENLRTIPVPLPPLAEQRRIAAVLDRADELRAKRRQSLAELQALPQAIFHSLVGDPVQNPRGWPRVTLAEVIVSAADGPHASPQYSRDGVPLLSTRHVRPGEIVWEDLKTISPAAAEVQWRKRRPARGDILYTKGGTTGVAAVVDTDVKFAVWVHLALLKLKRQLVEPFWLEEMLNSPFCHAQAQRLTQGIANRDLGLKKMVHIALLLPPLELQREFVRRRAAIAPLKRAQRASLAELDALFAALQHQAFGGDLPRPGG